MWPFSIRKPADDRGENDEDAYDGKHVDSSSAAAGLRVAGSPRPLPGFLPAQLLASMAWRARSSNCASVSAPSLAACAAPMLTVSETRSPHQRKSAVRASPASVLRVRRKHLRAALVRQNKKLIVSPNGHLLGRAQPMRQRAPHLLQHGVAGGCAVRLAQFLRLIHADPQTRPKGAPPRAKSSNSICSRSSNSSRSSSHAVVFAGLPVRQRVQALGGMKERGGADALTQAIAQNQDPRDHRHTVAQLVPSVYQGPAALRRCDAGPRILHSALASNEQRLQALREAAAQARRWRRSR